MFCTYINYSIHFHPKSGLHTKKNIGLKIIQIKDNVIRVAYNDSF